MEIVLFRVKNQKAEERSTSVLVSTFLFSDGSGDTNHIAKVNQEVKDGM